MISLRNLNRRSWHFDRGFLIVTAMAVLALYPFLSRAGMPAETDAELHIYRLAELTRMAQSGEFYPRWAANFYFGYGYPIFNYYAPLFYYAGLPLTLAGVAPVTAAKAVTMLGMLAGSWGMYGMGRDRWGKAAGFVAAAAYLFSPYIQFIEPHARGDLAESFSLGLLPLAWWALDRVCRQPSGKRLLLAAGSVAALILSHNLMALAGFGLLMAWALWLALTGECRHPWGGVSLFLGVGLSAFFWMPVWLEQDAVNLQTLIGNGSHFDYRNHFLSLYQLLQSSPILDWSASEPEIRFNLGVGQWLLALLGGLALLVMGSAERKAALFFPLAAFSLILLMTSLSQPLWGALPLLPYLQFPWRLLGVAAICLGFLAGIGVAVFLPANLGAAGALLGLMLLALPLTQPPPWGDFGGSGVREVAVIELQGRWLGTTSTADFLPATVQTAPSPTQQLVSALLNNRPIDRVNRVTLPEGATVFEEKVTALHSRYAVNSPVPFALRLFQYAFPGWEVQIDGKPTSIEVGAPEGFLVAPLPAGEHLVDVKFGNTLPRNLAAGISIISFACLLIIAARLAPRFPQPIPAKPQPITDLEAMALAFAAIFAAILMIGSDSLRRQSPIGEALPAPIKSGQSLGGEITLLGYDAPTEELQPGSDIEVSLYWQARRQLETNYQVFVHLLNEDGQLLSQSDKLNPGEYPTKRWRTDKYVRDHHQLAIPEGLPPGEYRLTVGIWLMAEGYRLQASGSGADVIELARFELP